MKKGVALLIDSVRAIVEETWNREYQESQGMSCDSYCFSEFQCHTEHGPTINEMLRDDKLMLGFMFYMLGFVKLRLIS